MFKWLTSKFTAGQTAKERRPAPPALRGTRAVRAKFDSAQTNAENRRHWVNADGLSPNAAIRPEIRRILRNRARYEVANNSYARGIVLTLANDTIGTGPRLQMLTPNPAVNRQVEEAFGEWASLAVEGVFDFPKSTAGGSAIAAGVTVYWSAGAQQATATSAGNKLIGKVVRAAADADATVRVRMMQ